MIPSGVRAAGSPVGKLRFHGGNISGQGFTTGHWEIAGLVAEKPFRIFPPAYPSFPDELIAPLKRRSDGRSSGTRRPPAPSSSKSSARSTGLECPICYTAADSILQIAAHEEVIPLAELYSMCEIAREICDLYMFPRRDRTSIYRPPGKLQENRPEKGLQHRPFAIDILQQHGVRTIGVEKSGISSMKRPRRELP